MPAHGCRSAHPVAGSAYSTRGSEGATASAPIAEARPLHEPAPRGRRRSPSTRRPGRAEVERGRIASIPRPTWPIRRGTGPRAASSHRGAAGRRPLAPRGARPARRRAASPRARCGGIQHGISLNGGNRAARETGRPPGNLPCRRSHAVETPAQEGTRAADDRDGGPIMFTISGGRWRRLANGVSRTSSGEDGSSGRKR
jgi:hypothetical protein